ncbi:hypothetical protein B0A49_01378 [Cryomyces minteri]|uniref:SPX domain-containing protein n=1 Tax=Cryomyces minteri TaxID=331657 RepID=A0A4U0XM71_9PEZI|nr:hypothetical protein B0A49_01378 [Cryomyces minteri]
MKYGETLRQRSIPEWGHYNVDYDDIKQLIKEHTTPGTGKALSIPGQGDSSAREFENNLFDIFADQHQRIDLFVKSKTGEIQRRLSHLSKQVHELSLRERRAGQRIHARRLERYGRIESEAVKAGDEIQSLSRFLGAQRIAFRKLLKKYKKWTGSETLESRFKEQIEDQPGNFLKADLGLLFDQWTEVLQAVRAPFQAGVRAQARGSEKDLTQTTAPYTRNLDTCAVVSEICNAIETGSEVDFDTALATLPLGPAGKKAVYWVHPDNLVELQVILLQHTRLYKHHAHGTPSASPYDTPSRGSLTPRRGSALNSDTGGDTGVLILDDLTRFAKEQSAITISDKEDAAGTVPEKATGSARWTAGGEVVVYVQEVPKDGNIAVESCYAARMKDKHLHAFLDVERPFPPRTSSETMDASNAVRSDSDVEQIDRVRRWLSTHPEVQPLVSIKYDRARFVALGNDSVHGSWATLDKNVVMRGALEDRASASRRQGAVDFPHVVLEVRQEGEHAGELIKVLDRSHLTERVRGFSLESHAVWTCCQPKQMPAPFWLPTLSKDIRKLPEAPRRTRRSSSNMGSTSQSTTPLFTSTSATSVTDGPDTGSSTALNSATTSVPSIPAQLESPPLSAFRKKRRRSYKQHPSSLQTDSSAPVQQRYWNEYDDPEESENENDAYILYIDPDAETPLSRIFRRLGNYFTRDPSPSRQRQPLLSHKSSLPDSEAADDSSSSEDDMPAVATRKRSYGTIGRRASPSRKHGRPLLSLLRSPPSPHHDLAVPLSAAQHARERTKLQAYTTSLVAAVVVLAVCFQLAATGRHRQATQVDAGIVFGAVASLLFAFAGAATFLTRKDRLARLHWAAVFGVFVVVCVANGVLLAWVVS